MVLYSSTLPDMLGRRFKKNIPSLLPNLTEIKKLKIMLRVSTPSICNCLHVIMGASTKGGPETDSVGRLRQEEKLQRNRFLGEQGTRELRNLLAGLVLRCFPKKVGQSGDPHKDWYSLPQGEDCFTRALHPYWQRSRA